MVKKTVIEEFLNHNKNLTLLDSGKVPKISNWTERKISLKQLFSHKENIGWVLGKEDLVVDVDCLKGGSSSFEKLKKFNLKKTVITPNGFHCYLKVPSDYQNSFRKVLKEFEGIDFISKGCQVLIPSCEVGGKEYVWHDDILGFFQEEAPRGLLEIIANKKEVIVVDQESFQDLIVSSIPFKKIKEILEVLDPSMPYEPWLKVGMALHNWDQNEGLLIWENWSKGGLNYEEGETTKKWHSFTPNDGVSVGTLVYMGKEFSYDNENLKIQEYIFKISFSTEKEIEFNLCPQIKKENFSGIGLEKIANSISKRLKELTGIRISISDIRKMVKSKEKLKGDIEIVAPEWCNKWVYVNTHGGFCNLLTFQIQKSEAFNIENGKYVPFSDTENKTSATKYVSDYGFIKKVDSIAYLPGEKSQIIDINGSKVLNVFNQNNLPLCDKKFNLDGKVVIKKILKHIRFICGNDDDSLILLEWLAHQIQYPGEKILWAPVIQSIEGVGKSFFAELLRLGLGDFNVGVVSPTQVVSNFNGWATNVCVNVLEELRVKGHNRHEAVNALKPLITDRLIQINDKGVKQYMTFNTANYICFTNFRDALPLEETDRRWWVIFVKIQNLKDMPAYVGQSAENYFPDLFDSMRNNGGQIRKFLLEYKIREEFFKIKQAPMTASKRSMITLEENSIGGYLEAKELISQGGKFFNEEIISSPDLFDTLAYEYPDINFNTSKRNIILKKLGFLPFPSRIKVGGKSRNIWVKSPKTLEEVKNLLKT